MLKKLFLWEYPRASWQYDIIVAAILAFIFLTPRDWFRDQPRIPHASSIALLPSEKGTTVFFVNTQMLEGTAEPQRIPKLTAELRTRMEIQRQLEV